MEKTRALGWDTETNSRGDLLILGNSDGNAFINFPSGMLLGAMFLNGRGRTNWLFNLDFDTSAVLKQAAMAGLRFKNGRAKLEGLKLQYIPNKFLAITRDGETVSFYDAANFCRGSLDSVGAELLHKRKIKVLHKEKMEELSWQDLRRYCVRDAELTAGIGEWIVKEVRKLGYVGDRFISPAKVAEQLALQAAKPEAILLRGAMRNAVTEFAERAYRGNFINQLVKGTFKDVTEADINSAYPAQIAELPDLSRGSWRYVHESDARALLGFYDVKMRLNGRIGVKSGDGRIYPVSAGPEKVTLSKPELWEFVRHGERVKVLSGVEFFSNEKPSAPLEDLVDRLYALKEGAKGQERELVKLVLNSMYGKFAQPSGKLYNPAFAAQITAAARVALWRLAANDFFEVYEYATDSVLGRSKNYGGKQGLGGWKVKRWPKVTFALVGVRFAKKGSRIATRGFGGKAKVRITGSSVEVEELRPLLLMEGIRRHKQSSICRFETVKIKLPLEDGRRVWFAHKFDLWHKQYSSEALDAAFVLA